LRNARERKRKKMRVLVLGGTSEANILARLLGQASGIAATLSFAGRTKAIIKPPIPYRIGGFGGAEGLTGYLKAERVDLLVDATHPFAEQISRHAAVAAARANIPLVVLSRPAWARTDEDNWIDAASMEDAALALGSVPRRVFLTIGRLQIEAFTKAPQHFYLIRTIESPAASPCLPDCRIIHGRGPFAAKAEETLLRANAIQVLVTKNSGGEAAFAKILAARKLALPVIMVARPDAAAGAALYDPLDAMASILRHQAALRGV
jgi:precorrin-6A/cobalt-precorrin-6A reductase